MSFPQGVTVTLRRTTVTGQDARGNDVTTAVSVPVPGSVLWPAGANGEQVQARDTTTTELVWAAPYGTVVLATDQAIVPGYGTKPFDVDGVPFSWQSPLTGTRAVVEVRLVRATG